MPVHADFLAADLQEGDDPAESGCYQNRKLLLGSSPSFYNLYFRAAAAYRAAAGCCADVSLLLCSSAAATKPRNSG